MSSVEVELALVALAAMLSPTTLSSSVLALVLSERPLRTGLCFYIGALGATLAVGVLGALVLGDAAAPSESGSPKTWVSLVDLAAGLLIVVLVLRAMRRPADPERAKRTLEQMRGVSAAPALAIVLAGAMLANAGGFMPLALKEISQLDPSASEYLGLWAAFALVALLPLAAALVMLAVARGPTQRFLGATRTWLERNARTIAAGILLLLAAALLRNGIAGLTS